MTCFLTKEPVKADIPAFFQMGRYGDIVLLLSAMKYWSDQVGAPVYFVTSKQFGSVLEGVSYVEPIIMPDEFNWHMGAGDALALATEQFPNIRRTQLHGHGWHTPPDSLPSYSISMWHRAGLTIDHYKSLPLIFDRRNPEREQRLIRTWRKTTKPLLLVNFEGATSPMHAHDAVIRVLAPLFDKFEVLNLNHHEVRAEKVFDLLGMMDIATGLITIDSLPIHLAAASKVRTINFVRDDGQAGSIPKNNNALTVGYGQVHQRLGDIRAVVEGWLR